MRFRWFVAAVALMICMSAAGAGMAVAAPAASVSGRIVSAPGASAFSPVATFPLPSGQTWFGSLAGSAQTLAATTVGIADPAHPTLSAYAFGRSPSGWGSSAPPAQLVFPDPSGVGVNIAAADDLVAVGDESTTSPSSEEISVFERPPTGWGGLLEPSATLDSSAPSALGQAPLAATEDAVFIAAGDTVDGFGQPASGWSGALHPSASLQISVGVGVQELAASGRTVVAEHGTALYVFEEPKKGWEGAISPAAVLTLPKSTETGRGEPLSIGASAIAVEDSRDNGSVFVFAKPAGGWRNSSAPVRLIPPPPVDPDGSVTTTIAGQTVVLQEAEPGGDHNCPCTDTLWAATPSANHWPPTTNLRVKGIEFGGNEGLTAAGSDVAATNGTEQLAVYAPSAPPSLMHATLYNPRGAHPRLKLTLARGTSGSKLRDIAIHPRGGLYLRPGSVREIRVSGARARVTYEPHTIEITDLSHSRRQIQVTIGGTVIQKSKGLSRRLAAARKSRAAVKIATVVKLMDQARRSHDAVVTFNVR